MTQSDSSELWTKEQLELAKEIQNEYSIELTQISFDKKTGQLILDLEALQVMAHALCPQIVEDRVDISKMDSLNGYHICNATLLIDNGTPKGKLIVRPGTALIGEQLSEEAVVMHAPQANNLAAARAYRSALRAIGFDPLRAHRQRSSGQPVTLEDEFESADKLRKELHALATDLGFIQGSNRTEYRELLRVMYGGRTSSLQLSDDEVRQLISFLRARLNARERARDQKAA